MSIETVLVAGATGRLGRDVVDVLLDAGYRVRGATTTDDGAESLEIQGCAETVVGDLRDADVAERAVEGVDSAGPAAEGTGLGPVDAVVSCVGSDPTDVFRDRFVDDVGVSNLVSAAVDAGVERFVLDSAIGVGDSKPGMPAPFRLAIRPIVQAKARGETAVRESGLEYVIVRPGGLTDGEATGDLLVAEGGDTVSGTVARRDVARLLVAALTTPEAANRTCEIVSHAGSRGATAGVVELDWDWPPG